MPPDFTAPPRRATLGFEELNEFREEFIKRHLTAASALAGLRFSAAALRQHDSAYRRASLQASADASSTPSPDHQEASAAAEAATS